MNPQVLPGTEAHGAPSYPDSHILTSGLATAKRLPTRGEQNALAQESHRGLEGFTRGHFPRNPETKSCVSN